MSSRPTEVLPRPVATGGEGGGGSAPLEKFEPPPPLGCSVPFAVTIGIEVYPPPPGILSAPPANDTWLRRWFYRLLVHVFNQV